MKKWIRYCILGLLFFLIAWTLCSGISLKVSKYTVSSHKIPEDFDGFKIAQISDLHNDSFGKNNKRLLKKIRKNKPDIIVITGDIADSLETENATEFVRQASAIAPTYYVPGNHEAWIDHYPQLESAIQKNGATVLRNETVYLFQGNNALALSGIDDPQFFSNTPEQSITMESALVYLADNTVPYQILLSHRPEYFEIYCENGYDLVFSGHAHGGQIRLPFVGGIYAPNQGLFPKYDSGAFTKDSTTMIVSRGLGNSVFFPRIGNRPEIVITQLKAEKF